MMSMPDDSPAPAEFAAIFDEVRAVPAGRVASYGDIALAVGVTARTVGWALSGCPGDVPWHRIVGADGYLRIAKRSPELKLRQAERLRGEGVVVTDAGFVERRFFVGADDEPVLNL
jgi:methylated-DNA-protein-cysteine methyltransferase-like protein